MKNLFGFGKGKTESSKNTMSKGVQLLKEMKDNIIEFVELGKTNRNEVRGISTLFMTNCNEGEMSATFSAVGDRQGLIEMLFSAMLEDEEFGKIMVTATEAAVYKDEELQDLQNTLKRSGAKVNKALKNSKGKQSMNISELQNMSEDEIIALAKKMANDRNDNDSE